MARARKATSVARPVTWKDVCALARALPETAVSTSYGTPSLKVKGKFLLRLKEDGETLAMRMGFLDRDLLMRAAPRTFYITDHYRDYPAVLVRLATVDRSQLAELLENAWRLVAPQRVVKEFDAAR
ncbi:MAG: MmcQ/YjbR family DNA-binding protein [Gemmatimonadaceae bacterium]